MRFAKSNDVLGTTNRGNPAESSLCTLCRADCMGQRNFVGKTDAL